MKSHPRIFVSGPLPGRAMEWLRAIGDVTLGEPGVGVRSPDFLAHAASFEALVTYLTDAVDRALLERLPALRLVANVAVGVDNIDVAACAERGVIVTNTPGVLTEATADLAFGLLLAASRRIAEGDRMVRAGGFHGFRFDTLVGARVHGATLGIVGFGRIGQAMARRARGFGMHVLYTQRTPLIPRLEAALGAAYVTMDELFKRSDAVSLHCPLTNETRGLVSAELLATMKPGSILINTARGACVDEAALANALREGPLGAAALDVFARESTSSVHIDQELLAQDNVVFTPHIASADRSTRTAMAETAAENAVAFFRDGTPPNIVHNRLP
ncbi:2-hydroxyacid dehydrogenase [Pendulispora albinea]|uniref:D-glycerate dehydrogenase n=1 Tax=Pendulispora albinea TaxID=2741071 RepID=A0ABZ2M9M1_9BACT